MHYLHYMSTVWDSVTGLIFNMATTVQYVGLPSITLPYTELLCGDKCVRYLLLNKNWTGFSTKHMAFSNKNSSYPCINQHMTTSSNVEEHIPLFHGSDVLNGISTAPKNFARIHARYMQKGLATKVHIQAGVAGGCSSSAWFYSIQGMFQVAFEYHSRGIQAQLLKIFTPTWMERFDDERLPEKVHVSWEHEPVTIVSVNNFLMPASEQTTSTSYATPIHQALDVTESFKGNDDTTPVTGYATESTTEKLVPLTYAATPYYQRHNNVPSEEIISCDFCIKCPEHSRRPVTDIDLVMCHLVRNIAMVIQSKQNRFSDVEILQSLVRHLHREFFMNQIDPDDGFPFYLIEHYLTLVHDSHIYDSFQNGFDILSKRSISLCVIADWLGKEFYRLNQKISVKVDTFKKENISSINELPKSAEIIERIFPRCMRVLCARWMGESDRDSILFSAINPSITQAPIESGMKTNTSWNQISNMDERVGECSSIDQSPVANICGAETNFAYIQFVLEIINKALVSGVSHVVFARLRQGCI